MAAETSMRVRATILTKEVGHYTVAAWGAVGIVHWMRQGDGPAMSRVRTSLEGLVDGNPRGVSFVHLIDAGAGLPDPEARRELSDMMASFAGETVCVGVVLLGRGFWASAMQSLLTGMRLLAPPRPWAMRFATRTSELGGWLPLLHAQRTQHVIDPEQLEAVLEGVLSAGAHDVRLDRSV